MLFRDTETYRVNRLIDEGAGAGLTERQFFAKEIVAWEHSQERMEQIKGDRYFKGYHDILDRKRTAIGPDGKLVTIENLPNNKVIDNQYAKMVNQKTNYLFSKPFILDSENKQYVERLNKVFDRKFKRLLKYIGEDALNGGKGWMFVYYDDRGALSFRRFPAYEILPFWADDDHTILDAAARLYIQEVWEGYTKKRVKRVEIYKPDGLYRYILDGSELVVDVELGEYSAYISVAIPDKPVQIYTWDKFPLIPWKYNKQEIPLIRRVKSLQDGINTMMSNFENGMEEDSRNTILIITNYDGENLGEFRRNLSTYGAVKVRDDGGVDALTIEVSAENYKAILEMFKKALIENAGGYDAKDDRLNGSPNQMNIQSMYSDIDLDANGTETEFQAAFEDLFWFINQDFKTKGLGDFEHDEVDVVFNRDILISETEAIDNCGKSVGILSEETIIEQHPWTKDTNREMERLKKERREAMNAMYQDSFQKPPGELNDAE